MVPTVPPTTDDVLDGTSVLLLGLPYWAWTVIAGGIVLWIIFQVINKLPFKQLFFGLLFIVVIILMFGK